MATKVSAIDISKLWFADVVTEKLTPAKLKALIATATEIINVHQDTWSIDESEASQDTYKNQLSGATYRMGKKTMGDVTFNFTVGQYDYATKASLMGGEVIMESGQPIGWSRQRGTTEVKKCVIALTEDNVYCVLPEASISGRESNTDGAIGLAVTATMLEPSATEVMPEYWYDKSAVDA